MHLQQHNTLQHVTLLKIKRQSSSMRNVIVNQARRVKVKRREYPETMIWSSQWRTTRTCWFYILSHLYEEEIIKLLWTSWKASMYNMLLKTHYGHNPYKDLSNVFKKVSEYKQHLKDIVQNIFYIEKKKFLGPKECQSIVMRYRLDDNIYLLYFFLSY